jgi:hypothetical protein
MDQQTPILQKIGEAVALIKQLQQEKDQAIALSQQLQQENEQMKALMALTESKLDEMLVVGSVSGNQPRERAAATNCN